MIVLKKICLFFLCLLLLLIITLFFLFNTNSGLHFLLKNTLYWIPDLKIMSIKGNVHDFNIKNLHYQSPNINININDLHIKFHLSNLWSNKLCIDKFLLNNISIELNTFSLNTLAKTLINNNKKIDNLIRKYNQFILNKFFISNAFIKINNHTNLTFKELNSGFIVKNKTLTITSTLINGLTLELSNLINLFEEKNFNLMQQFKVILNNFNLQDIEIVNKLINKPLLKSYNYVMPFDVILEEIKGENWCLLSKRCIVINNLYLQATNRNSNLNLNLLKINTPNIFMTMYGHCNLSNQWPLHIVINTFLKKSNSKIENVICNILGKLRDELCMYIDCHGIMNVKLLMKTNLTKIGIPIQILLNSSNIQWSYNKNIIYQADHTLLKVHGYIQNYNIIFQTILSGSKIPIMNIDMNAKGNIYGLKLSSLKLNTLEGCINIIATINWRHSINWQSKLNIDHINTTYYLPYCPIKITGGMNINGIIYNNAWQVYVPTINFSGMIRQNKFLIQGSLNKDINGKLCIPKLLIALGGNNLKIQGYLKDKFAFDIKLYAPTLYKALSNSNSNFQGNIKLCGDIHTPTLKTYININSLSWKNVTIKNILLNSNIQFTDVLHGNMNLIINQLQHDKVKLDKLMIEVNGNEIKHDAKVLLQGESTFIKLKINGIYDRINKHWQCLINKNKFTTSCNDLYLVQNIIHFYQDFREKLFVKYHNWLIFSKTPPNLPIVKIDLYKQLNIILNYFNLNINALSIPKNMQISGVFSGDINLFWNTEDNIVSSTISLLSNSLKIERLLLNELVSLIDFDVFKLIIQTHNESMSQLHLIMNIINNGAFDGHLYITAPHQFSSNINIMKMSLKLFKPFFTYCEHLDGILNVNLDINNSEQLKIFGKLIIKSLFVQGINMPLIINDSCLTAIFNGTKSILHGTIRTVTGKMNLNGSINWNKKKDWYANVNIKGKKMLIDISPNVKFILSPDITFKANANCFIIDGDIYVPWANIKIQESAQNSISISTDEVLLNNETTTSLYNIYNIVPIINVLMHIGNDVNIKAFGLQAKFEGDLKVSQNKNELIFNGILNIPVGKLHAYDQDLIINTGQLLFSGPIDRPQLNIEAIRNPNNIEDHIIAGIRINGYIDQPKLEIFSDPIKSQQETLSYLLFGKGINVFATDNMMTSILIRMGIAQSKQIMGKIGGIFGLSSLALDIAGYGNNSQVVVSSSILPGFQIKYNIGIFDSSMTFTIRYYLIPKLYLEIISGVNQTLELFYRFEF